jgi:uncharacterized protein
MEHITALCRKHKVRSLHAFGSAVKGDMGPESDVDLVVDLPLEDPFEFSEHYWALEDSLIDLFKRPVDLVSGRALRNKYFIDELNSSKVKLYEA